MGVYDVAVDVPVDDLLACNESDVGNLLRLYEVVGKGGFATVWRASFDGNLCACKILQPRGGRPPPAPIVHLFIQECRSLVTMEHSAVIRCFGLIKLRRADVPELGLAYDTYGMLLEFCEGGTLKDLLMAQLVQCRDHYTVREVLAWLSQVASALNQFHSLGMPIIHRDIKPENILLQIEEVHDEEAIAAAATSKHRGSGGGGAAAAQQRVWYLQAKLADLGLGVRVGTDRSVLVRRRTTPLTGESKSGPGSGSAEAPPPVDDEGVEVLLGPVIGGVGAAAATASASAAGRLPFMGFTTSPLQPLMSKRQGSNQWIGVRTPSVGGGGGSASPTPVSGSASPPLPCGGAPADCTLHKATLLNSLRTRMSGRVDSDGGAIGAAAAAADGTSRVPSAGASPAVATPCSLHPEEGDLLLRPQSSNDPSHANTPPHAYPSPRTERGGGGGGSVDRSGDAGPSPFRDYFIQHSPSTSGMSGTDTEAGGPTEAVQRPCGANLHPDGAPAEATSRPQSESPDVASPPCIAASTGAEAGGGLASPTAAATAHPHPHLPPVAASAFVLGYTQSLGHAPGHGTAGPSLPPISERSLSAEDATIGSSICGGGGGTATGSSTAASSMVLGSVGTAQSSIPAALRPGGGSKMPLYVIKEPDDSSSPPLPTAASAPHALTSSASNSTAAVTGGGTASPRLPPAASHDVLTSAAASVRHTLQKAFTLSPVNSRVPSPLGPGAVTADAGPAAACTAPARTASCPHVPPASSSPSPSPWPGSNGTNDQPPTVNRNSEAVAGASRDSNVVGPGLTTTATGTGHGRSTLSSVGSGSAAAGPAGPRSLRRTGTSTASRVSRSSFPRGETTNSPLLSPAPSRDRASLGMSALLRPNLRELSHSESLSRAMRKIGSLLRSLNKASLPKFRPDSEFQWVYALTGQAGSCMYMAPEVFRGEPYNEKVDVYSFGVMMYELLARELLLVKYMSGSSRAGQELGVKDPQQYARKVCEGFRPPRHPRIPEAIWQLVQRCWHPDPFVRPDMAEVQARLEAAFLEWDWQRHPATGGVGAGGRGISLGGAAAKARSSDNPAGRASYGKDPGQASQPRQRRQAKQQVPQQKQPLLSNSGKEQGGDKRRKVPAAEAVALGKAAGPGSGGEGEGEEEGPLAGPPTEQKPVCCVIC